MDEARKEKVERERHRVILGDEVLVEPGYCASLTENQPKKERLLSKLVLLCIDVAARQGDGPLAYSIKELAVELGYAEIEGSYP